MSNTFSRTRLAERTLRATHLLGHAAAPALFFGLGIGFTVAWRHRLYANAAVAILCLLWAAALRRNPALPTLLPDSPSHGLSPDTQAQSLRLRMMLDQTPAPLVLADQGGALRAVNRAARALFRTDDLIMPRPPALVAAMASELPGNRTILLLPDPPGGEPARSYALQVALVSGAAGLLRLGVLTDIQSELQSAEAAALRQLLQLLSHELMNSLTPVASLAESAHAILVEEGAGGVARAAEALKVILRRTQGLDGFVRGYRALARLPAPVLRPVGSTALLDDAAALFHTRWEKLGVSLVTRCPVPDVTLHCDAGQVTQALLNLLANAAEATLENAPDTTREVRLQASAQGAGVEFLVSDNGPGVQADHVETIFRPFFTTKPGGDGIGLALARQIALAHGGKLQLSFTGRSRGATFAFAI